MSSINPVGSSPGFAPIRAPSLAGGEQNGQSGVFQSVLSDAIQKVERFRADSEQGIERLLAGEPEELHRVALAAQQAELAFELFLQVKNKVVQAYQEVMRMQV